VHNGRICKRRLHTQEDELAARREQCSQAQVQAQAAEFQAPNLRTRSRALRAGFTRTYLLSIDEALESHGTLTPDPEELARIKRRLEGMGAVKPRRTRGARAVRRALAVLQAQQQDLLKAKDDLHQAIAKINTTTREQFKTTFEAVRANFRSLFQTLFRGRSGRGFNGRAQSARDGHRDLRPAPGEKNFRTSRSCPAAKKP